MIIVHIENSHFNKVYFFRSKIIDYVVNLPKILISHLIIIYFLVNTIKSFEIFNNID